MGLVCFQTAFDLFPETPLHGYVPKLELPEASLAAWTEGEFQETIETRNRGHFGFRAPIVRFVNQIRYTFFGEHNEQVVVGTDGVLFEEAYRASVCGKDYIGDVEVSKNIKKIEAFYNELSKRGKKLVIMIAPNKWRTFHDLIDWDCKAKRSNYSKIIPVLRERGFAVCDLVDVFQYEHEQGTSFPLHSRQGTHWSVFGAASSVDYLRFSFAEQGITLPKAKIESTEESELPRGTDKDLHELLNLMQNPDQEKLGYPELAFSEGSKLRVLVVGDSYYWNYYDLGVHDGLFAPGSKFFYYNRTMVEFDPGIRTEITPELRKRELNDSDVVLLVMSEPSLKKFGFGLLEDFEF